MVNQPSSSMMSRQSPPLSHLLFPTEALPRQWKIGEGKEIYHRYYFSIFSNFHAFGSGSDITEILFLKFRSNPIIKDIIMKKKALTFCNMSCPLTPSSEWHGADIYFPSSLSCLSPSLRGGNCPHGLPWSRSVIRPWSGGGGSRSGSARTPARPIRL